MAEVATAGRTVVFVSHNLATLEALCTKGLFLEDGRLVQQGPLKEVLTEYTRLVRSPVLPAGSSADVAGNFKSKYKYFRGIDLLDENGESTLTVAMGRSIKIRFRVETEQPIENPVFLVGFENLLGGRVLTVFSPKNSKSLSTLNGLCEITCDIGSLPLAPDDYGIFLALLSGSKVLEGIPVELYFSVRNADTFGDGWGYTKGTCVARADWHLTQAKPTPK